MLRRERKRNNIIIFSIFMILFVAVGYSLVTANIEIRANLKVAESSFDVHFENARLTKKSIYKEIPQLEENNYKISANIELKEPGDFYEITADIVNDGTLNASLGDFVIEGIPEEIEDVITYSVVYTKDNQPLKNYDVIKSGNMENITIKIMNETVENENELLEHDYNFNISIYASYEPQKNSKEIEYNVRYPNLYKELKKESNLDNQKSEFVNGNNGIDFTKPSSGTNGKGLYTISETSEDEFPIMYFRGSVENNFVKIYDDCFQIVRTTSLGDIKLVYFGSFEGNICIPDTSEYKYVYNSVEFQNNASVGILYGELSSTYEETHQNNNKSNIYSILSYSKLKYGEGCNKNYVFNYELLGKNETCTDRNVSSTINYYHINDTALGYGLNDTYYSGYNRIINIKQPSLDCSSNDIIKVRQLNYRYDEININPIGLLTADELVYAGIVWGLENSDNYLRSNGDYWLATPHSFTLDEGAQVFYVTSTGKLDKKNVGEVSMIRPTLVLSNKVDIKEGIGTREKPYVINNLLKGPIGTCPPQ